MSHIDDNQNASISRAAATIPGSYDAQGDAGMVAQQLEMSASSKEEAQEIMSDITVQQDRKKTLVQAIHAARDLRSSGRVRGYATQAEYEKALAACKLPPERQGAVYGWLQKFCQKHGVRLEAIAGSQNQNSRVDVLAVLQKLQAVTLVCDAAQIALPTAEDVAENQAQWDVVIASLQSRLDATGADMQSGMAQLHNALGVYGSHVQDASAAMRRGK
ncbi:MAG: hypothetical protein IJU37_00565 [Desulfovibrio sp.]|nr:hypothetical protein [Desulfovibrio sp.]